MKYAKKVDKNQPAIVEQLRKSGFTVETDKDDIIVGKHGKTRWIEIKDGSPFGKRGKLIKGMIKDSQYKILWNWNGQYNICWDVEQILNICNDLKFSFIEIDENKIFGISPGGYRKNYKDYLTPSELTRLRKAGIINDGR